MTKTRPVYIQNMACVVTNEDMCSFGYLSVVHHRMRQTSSIALNERLKQTKNLVTIKFQRPVCITTVQKEVKSKSKDCITK